MLKWASSLDQLWQTPGLVSLLGAGAAAFFVVILIVVALRADKTFANVVLVLITLITTGSLAWAMLRGHPSEPQEASSTVVRTTPSSSPSLAALACLDGLAGNGVETACERALFGSPDAAAAAVSYTASQLSRLSPADAMSSRTQTVEGTALRRTLERDRYGLVAQVLTVREGCTPANCPTFKIFSDSSRITANMNERAYETTIGRYALTWPAGSTVAGGGASGPLSAMSGAPLGRPTGIDFPSAASTPPVNIMIGEPPSSPIPPRAAVAAPAPKAPPKELPKKQAAKQNPKAPVQLTPPADGADDAN